MARVPDTNLQEVRDRGFTLMEGFLEPDELQAAQAGMWEHFPSHEDYFAEPGKYTWATESQFAGLRLFPYKSWDLNRIAFHPDLVDAAERLLGSTDLDLYKVELWAKYSGAIDYDQPHHYDFMNHTLVVPRRDQKYMHMTCFILLSDVTAQDGPTKLVPVEHSRELPLVPNRRPVGEFADVEVAATGPAGTLMIYRTDVLHRGSNFTGESRSRFALLCDYKVRGGPWAGKMSWPDHTYKPGWNEAMERATVRERDLFGFPRPGSDYWNEQTLADVALRYPGMDMSPYANSS